jgi:hypothetical protein
MEVEAVSEEFARMKASLEMIDGDWIHVDNDFTITNVVLTNE